MMKIAELEKRVVHELQEVLETSRVSLIETGNFRNFACKAGCQPNEEVLSGLTRYQGIRLPEGQLFPYGEAAIFLIGDWRGMTNLILIEGRQPKLYKTPVKVWIRTLSRYLNVCYDNMLKINDLTDELERLTKEQKTPAWLPRLQYAMAEKERKHLSQDLHDSVLQEQIILYRKLELVQYSEAASAELKQELQDIGEGMLDIIHQIRMTCNELRPPFLKEWGLNQALEALYEHVQMRVDYRIIFDSERFCIPLPDEQMIAVYRINQELLNNAYKHSQATEVFISIADHEDGFLMTYQDNGIGLQSGELRNSYKTMGLYGIRERVRSLEGEIHVLTAPGEGLTIHVYLPCLQTTIPDALKTYY
ncbi:sensor histidine kinase [Paenibacillus caui]|uniref:sensor histidine kinase n=1 Tax=Paenibacillus caui TaxID=2873927 RepID=UPI001CA85915|nr:sensor histidine kinase [Paenibacillus caui]